MVLTRQILKQLTLLADADELTLAFTGKLQKDKYEGDVDINSGTFSMTFSMKRQTKVIPAESDQERQTKTALSDLPAADW